MKGIVIPVMKVAAKKDGEFIGQLSDCFSKGTVLCH